MNGPFIMEAKQVIDKILNDAQAKAEKIMAEAGEKQKAELEKVEKEIQAYNEETDRIVQKTAQDIKENYRAAARMENSKALLAEKRKIINEIFSSAADKLRQLSDQEYLDLMKKLMLKAVETGDEQIVLDNNEKRIDQVFIKTINRELGPGYQGNLKIADKTDDLGGGGFILKRGLIKNNVSFYVLLEQARTDLEMDLAKDLFK